MKKNLILVTGLLAGSSLYSQAPGTTGSIAFEEKLKIEINFGGSLPPGLDSLPKEHKSNKTLLFSPEATLFEKSKTDKEVPPDQMECSGGVQVRMADPDNFIYCDMKAMKTTEQKEFMSRTFLINADLGRFKWKLTGRQKTIANYPCQEAVSADTATKATAWFTSAIPVSSGPAGYGNLPGMILELVLDKGDHTITATNIEMKEIDTKLLVKPKKGKKVTHEEYRALVDEKMKEMGAQGGGGHQMIIKISR